jgi:hypothetical protein
MHVTFLFIPFSAEPRLGFRKVPSLGDTAFHPLSLLPREITSCCKAATATGQQPNCHKLGRQKTSCRSRCRPFGGKNLQEMHCSVQQYQFAALNLYLKSMMGFSSPHLAFLLSEEFASCNHAPNVIPVPHFIQ